MPDSLVALLNTLAAAPNEPVGVSFAPAALSLGPAVLSLGPVVLPLAFGAAARLAASGWPSHWYNPKITAAMTAAATDACHGTVGAGLKPGMDRSRGIIMMSAARVVSIPAKYQNTGIQ
jgi:hypothetical protein